MTACAIDYDVLCVARGSPLARFDVDPTGTFFACGYSRCHLSRAAGEMQGLM